MADIKTLGTIKAETGRNLDELTEDNDNVFVETSAGVAGVSSIFKLIARRIHNVLSGLTALASGADTDYAVVVRNGTAEKITLNKLADYVMASGADASVDSLTVTGSASFGGTIGGSGINALLSDYYNKQSVDSAIKNSLTNYNYVTVVTSTSAGAFNNKFTRYGTHEIFVIDTEDNNKYIKLIYSTTGNNHTVTTVTNRTLLIETQNAYGTIIIKGGSGNYKAFEIFYK